jgi:hypothetical protein
MRKFAFAVLPLAFALSSALAQTSGCSVPENMTKDQKLPCLKAGVVMLDQPTLTATQIQNGPDFDSTDAAPNHFSWFTANDAISCYFRPHYAFSKVPGDSMKFQCWHMTPQGGFYGSKGDLVQAAAVKVVISKDKSGQKSATLYPADDAADQHEIKADHFKIKYLKPPFPAHNPRFNEVFTGVATTRLMWVLGFPADRIYPAGAASCIGCSDDPFGNKLTENKASLQDPPAVFKIVSAERELPWDEINPDDDETWSWTDAARFYSDGEWTHEQKVGFDAYRLALGLLHYFNALPQQNRLDCAEWAADHSTNGKTCLKPVFYVHDLGSTFGKKRSALDLLGTNPRGIYSAYAQQTVFANTASCQLRDSLLGDKQVLREAQEMMIQRLTRLDRDTVKSIFRIARFDMMDQEQVRRLRAKGVSDTGEAALDEWTDAFMKRIEEIRTAQNCKAS